MTTQPTDPSPLLFAEYLKDDVEIYDMEGENGITWKQLAWKNGQRPDDLTIVLNVLETEYLDLCHRIESKFTEEQQISLVITLWYLTGQNKINKPAWQWNQEALNKLIWWALAHATWQQRLAAIQETLKGTKL